MDSAAITILVIDDQIAARATLEGLLSVEPRYSVRFAASGAEGLSVAQQVEPDVILLDVMMPEMDGFEVCRRVRDMPRLAEVPVLLITSLDDRDSRLKGLRAGADDFISKPFGVREVVARMRAVTRRLFKARAEERREPEVVRVGHLEVYPQELRARKGDETIDLSLRDVRILLLLQREKGRVVTREMLFNECWDMQYLPNSRTIDQHISKLRKRVELDPGNPTLITTVHGVGYRID